MKNYLCKCFDCNVTFESTDERHTMVYCPKCKKNAVDIEEHYARQIGNCKIIKELK